MKLFSSHTFKTLMFTFTAAILPLVGLTAKGNKAQFDVIKPQFIAFEQQFENIEVADEDLDLFFSREAVRRQLLRFFTNQDYFLFDGGQLVRTQIEGLSLDVYFAQFLPLIEAIEANIQDFQDYVEFETGRPGYAERFANILRFEVQSFFDYEFALILGNTDEAAEIQAEWLERVPRALARAFAGGTNRYQAVYDEAQNRTVALQYEAGFLAVGSQFNPVSLLDAIYQLQVANHSTRSMIAFAIPDPNFCECDEPSRHSCGCHDRSLFEDEGSSSDN